MTPTTTRSTSSDREGPSRPVTELTFSEASEELDAIVADFERGIVDLDDLVERLQRATSIVEELDERLARTRLQVDELLPKLEAVANAPEIDADGED